jgi:hypothetical protein
MNARHLILGIAATVSAAGFVALPTGATARTLAPSASAVSLKMVTGVAVKGAGDYEIEVSATHPVDMCSFKLWRYTDYWGSFQYLGSYNGTSMTDELLDNFVEAEYEMQPFDCSGNHGAFAFSAEFWPMVQDNPFAGSAGSFKTVSNKKFFGGSALETLTDGSAAEWHTSSMFNLGVVVDTGPTGGIGTVSVDGTSMGTINFYSAKLGSRLVEFKYGTPNAASVRVDVVCTGKGAGGGYDMWLDAGTLNSLNP